MGISTEQWRAAIGTGARSSAPPLRCATNSAGVECNDNAYIPHSLFNRSMPCLNIPWKLASLGLLLICLASTCQTSLLLIGGIEANPGPPKGAKNTAANQQQPPPVSPEVQAIRDGQQSVLDKLIAVCTSVTVKQVLRRYDPTQSTAKLKDIFNGCSKPHLVETMSYLKTVDQEPFLKGAVVDNLISRLQNLFPDKCQICSETYATELDEKPLISCEICGQGCHNDCLAGLLSIAQDDIPTISEQEIRNKLNPHSISGLHYLCGHCSQPGLYLLDPAEGMKKARAKKQAVPAVSAADPSQDSGAGVSAAGTAGESGPQPVVIKSTSSDAAASSIAVVGALQEGAAASPPEADTDDEDEDLPDDQFIARVAASKSPRVVRRHHKSGDEPVSSTPPNITQNKAKRPSTAKKKGICWKYAKGKCEHGMKGTGCERVHPAPCFKYLKNGTRPGRGCDKGSKCDEFHVKLCNNSLTKGECLDEACVKHHTTGTRRHNSRPLCKSSLDKNECFDKDCQRYHQKGTKRVPPTQQQRKRDGDERPQAQVSSTINEQHFLDEILRSLRAEIDRAVSATVSSQIDLLRSEGGAQQVSRSCNACVNASVSGGAHCPATATSSWPRLGQLQPCPRLNHH